MSYKMIKIMCLPSRYIKRSNNKYVIQEELDSADLGAMSYMFTSLLSFPLLPWFCLKHFPSPS